MANSRVRVPKSVVPNLITAGAVLAGYISIIESFQGNFLVASACIIIACILDMLDGRVARLMNASSEFGVQFDSLADAINYGVAPALLFYQLYFNSWGIWGILLSFLIVASAAVRLARFNVTADSDIPTTFFTGLPSTMSAFVMASFVLFAHAVYPNYGSPYTAMVVIAVLAFLMVSEVQYEKRNIFSFRYIRKTRRLLTGTFILVSIIAFPSIAFFAWGMSYILYGLARSTIATFLSARGEDEETEEDDTPQHHHTSNTL